MTRAALVVGINTYSHFRDLKAPAQDAEAIAQRLQQDGEFKVTRLPEALVKEDARLSPAIGKTLAVTQGQLEAALKQLFRPDSAQIPDTALFYFSGHGLPDPEGEDGLDKGYLVSSDTDPHQTRPGVSLAWLQNLLARSPIPNQIVWLDCCHSGGLLIDVQAANPGHSHSRSRCFIASSRDFEKSWQDLNSPYSVLTKALLDGLDPTRLLGRWVDTFALVDYVNQALKGDLQTPTCTNFGDAINLTRTWRVADAADTHTEADSGLCPYKGLEFFDWNEADAQYFFGREALTSQLLDQVRTTNFMALVGASGNGKSSVLRAGLLYQLQLGRRIAGSDQWQILLMRPDDQPMQHLAEAFLPPDGSQLDRAEALGRAEGLLQEGGAGLARLVQAAAAPRVVLVIDQFEEVFTRCEDIAEREQFFDCLMGALEIAKEKLCLIIAMRSDFVGKCLERDYSGLAQRVQEHMVSVLPMPPDDLEKAIRQPADAVGLKVDDALVTEILDDVKGSPGSLPLLQYTLKELWQRRQGNRLVLSAYQELGGINGTLDKRATELYEKFNDDEQRTARHIFQQLTQLGEGTEDTRRRVFLDNLIAAPLHPAKQVKTVIETLSDRDNRLLVTSEVVSKDDEAERRAIVDVAHEALIRHWRLLRQWIEQNRDLLRQQRRIEASAVTWQERQQSKGYLLQGLPLDEAIRFQKRQADTFPLSDAARVFIRRSRRQRQWNGLKAASALLILVPIVDYSLHRSKIEQHYNNLNGADRGEERESAFFLTHDCVSTDGITTGYFLERFGQIYCRSLNDRRFSPDADLSSAYFRYADLSNTDLSDTDLSKTDLSYADLRSAFLHGANLSGAFLAGTDLASANFSDALLSDTLLRSADLRSADLRSADLSSADLSNADLSDADLSNADLSDANLSGASLLKTDLRDAKNLTLQQLTGESQPYLCNTALPDSLKDTDPNRDCRNIDFSDVNLSNADLSDVNLSDVNLSDTDLSNAVLINADLSDTDLSNAVLSDTDLSNADLSDTDLSNANLSNAVLYDANLINADLSDTDLSNANLYDAILNNADLRFADLSNANLYDAVLSNADLSNADLSNADLRTDLSNADLSNANLRFAYLRFAYLSNADLSDADLSDADLSAAVLSADLSNADLSGAILLATDLRDTNLTAQQLTGENPPYLCNVALPDTLKDIDLNRDCETLQMVLAGRYGWGTQEEAEAQVQELMQRQWE